MAKANDFIGNYQVISDLGGGAFGRVYKAQHRYFANRIVAIKLMRAVPLHSGQERDRFLQEAQFLDVLKHPHILTIIDVGFHEDIPYLVTTYAPRGSLKDLLIRQAGKLLPAQQIMTILSQIKDALEHAHRQNIVHRDLKPENILFDASGNVLLADFGVATILDTASLKQGTIVGTPSYMAPEQFRGLVSKASDQYALGCIAYELVTGRKPFTATDIISLALKHAMEAPPPPRQINPTLPIHIEQAILKALAKQHTERFLDVAAFVAALRTPSPSPLRPQVKQLRLDPAQLTDVGRKRPHNEDNMAYVIPKDLQVMAKKGALFIVADGRGGQAAGEVASEIAVDTVCNLYYQDDSEDVPVALLQAIKRANALIYQRVAENMSHSGIGENMRSDMGTTCVAAVLHGKTAYIANVGNSRAYLLHAGQVKQVSQDHSWVAEQLQFGLLTEAQARSHAQRHILTRCLGTQSDVAIDFFLEELQEGDSLVLCTDGLSDLVSNKELLTIVEQHPPQESVYLLVERANENGGPDNITAIVVRIKETG